MPGWQQPTAQCQCALCSTVLLSSVIKSFYPLSVFYLSTSSSLFCFHFNRETEGFFLIWIIIVQVGISIIRKWSLSFVTCYLLFVELLIYLERWLFLRRKCLNVSYFRLKHSHIFTCSKMFTQQNPEKMLAGSFYVNSLNLDVSQLVLAVRGPGTDWGHKHNVFRVSALALRLRLPPADRGEWRL